MAGRSASSRTRAGCWACKASHLKCDGIRPSCQRCSARGESCTYGLRLRWQEDSVSRGICHGRSKVSIRKFKVRQDDSEACIGSTQNAAQLHLCRKARHERQSFAFLNTTSHDVASYFDNACHKFVPAISQLYDDCDDSSLRNNAYADAPCWRKRLPVPELDLQRLTMFPSTSTMHDFDPSLLSYYESVICSSSTLLDDEENNPYRHFILPMAMHVESIFHAVLAVTAQILSISNASYRVAALEHSIYATRALADVLQQSRHDRTKLREMQVLTLILCWTDITNHSSASWLTHLYGMQSMLSQSERLDFRRQDDSFHRFLTRYFAFHWVLARTAFALPKDDLHARERGIFHQAPVEPSSTDRDHSLSFSAWTEYLSLHMPLDDMEQIDPYMGMSNSLLLLINETAEIYEENLTNSAAPAQRDLLRARFRHIRTSLRSLAQRPPPRSNEDEEQESAMIAEANRLGALLYLHAVGVFKFARMDLWSSENGASEVPGVGEQNRMAQETDALVKDVLNLITNEYQLVSRCAAMPLWPLFMAGCFSVEDTDRIRVSSLFDRLEGLRRFGNITPARKVVQCVWKQHDLSVQDDRKRLKTINELNGQCNHHEEDKGSRRFAWEFAMKMLGNWKLSLT